MKSTLKGRSLLTLKDSDTGRGAPGAGPFPPGEKGAQGRKDAPPVPGPYNRAALRETLHADALRFRDGIRGGGRAPHLALSTADVHLGVKETIEDTARVLGRMFDAIQFRGFKQSTVETLGTMVRRARL